MLHSYTIEKNGIFLNPLEEQDLEFMRNLRNYYRYCFLTQEIIESEQQMAWFENYKQKENDFVFLAKKKSGEKIGIVSLYHVDKERKTAEFGRIMISPECSGQGFGKIITFCACQIGFTKLQLEKIYLTVFSDNEKAIRSYQRVGFKLVEQLEEIKKLNKMELLRASWKEII